MKRWKKWTAGTLVGGLALIPIAGGVAWAARDRIVEAAIQRQISERPDSSYTAADGRIRVLLCGTGTPEASGAAQACTLVAAGGRIFLFDVGDGAASSLGASDVPVNEIEQVFLTHFHSDHFNGLGTLINTGWIWGRATPLTVAGPVGTNDVVSAMNDTYDLDRGYRASNVTGQADTMAASYGRPKEIEFGAGQRQVRVYDEGGVTIDARLVAHDPVEPALGYIVRYAGKKVFISGDTMVTSANLPAMRDADLVVHEAYATHLVRRAIPVMREQGQDEEAEIAERTVHYHADTIKLAKQAQEAGVKHLVLTHLTPYPRNALARRLFVQGMSDEYAGKLTLGKDGLRITL